MQQKWISALLRTMTVGSALLCGMIAVSVIGFIVWHGCPTLGAANMPGDLLGGSGNLGSPASGWAEPAGGLNMSWLPALWNTLFMIAVVLLPAVPIGAGAAIFLSEYARRGSRFAKTVSLAAETLAGIPSVLFGLFGFLLFVLRMGWGYSFLAGVCTLILMVLPLIIRTTQEALRTVPAGQREASFGLGAGKGRTVLRVLLPAALPGMLAGILLAIGRITGESAALLFTAGTGTETVDGIFSSAATLAVHLYAMLVEGQSLEGAYQTALVLLLLTAALNLCVSLLTAHRGGHRK